MRTKILDDIETLTVERVTRLGKIIDEYDFGIRDGKVVSVAHEQYLDEDDA